MAEDSSPHLKITVNSRTPSSVDGAGAAHYWDGYEQAVVVIQDAEVAKVELAETPFQLLLG